MRLLKIKRAIKPAYMSALRLVFRRSAAALASLKYQQRILGTYQQAGKQSDARSCTQLESALFIFSKRIIAAYQKQNRLRSGNGGCACACIGSLALSLHFFSILLIGKYVHDQIGLITSLIGLLQFTVINWFCWRVYLRKGSAVNGFGRPEHGKNRIPQINAFTSSSVKTPECLLCMVVDSCDAIFTRLKTVASQARKLRSTCRSSVQSRSPDATELTCGTPE